MNQYGSLAMQHWRRWLPLRYSKIGDPQEFFSSLGETVSSQVDQLADQLAGPDQRDESTLAKMGRLNAARRQAEEVVLADLVYLEPEPGMDEEGLDEDPDSPAARIVTGQQLMQQMMDEQTQQWQQDLDSRPRGSDPTG